VCSENPEHGEKAKCGPSENFLLEMMARMLEEWRKETVPERDDLLGDSDGDNARHVIIRGAFLDLLFKDKRINTVIEGWVNRTPLKARFEHLVTTLDELAVISKVPLREIPWDEEAGFTPTIDDNDEVLRASGQQATLGVREFLDEVRSFPSTDVFGCVVNDIVQLVESLDMPYQWLVLELAQVYFARLFINDYSWQYAGNLEVEESADYQSTPEVDFKFHTLGGETVKQAVDRLKSEVEQVTDERTRFVERLPRGSVPDQTQPILTKYAEWLYRNKVTGASIRSIATQDFLGEYDRRKDVRDGIIKAQELLSLGRSDFPRPDMSSWQLGGV